MPKDKILVIDDEHGIQETLKMILEYEGYRYFSAFTGEEGLREIEEEHPDVIFLDIKMPNMDGGEVFDILKKKPEDGAFYVVSKDIKANTITVSNKKSEIDSLSPKKIVVKGVNWITEPKNPLLSARIRYRGNKVPATLFLEGKELGIEFQKPINGLSLGQSIVFYLSPSKVDDGDYGIGGGVMDRVIS